MSVYSFDGAFANLNNSISNIGKGFEERKKREAIAGAGQKLAAGDHNGAAQDLLAFGDVGNGLKAIELGRTHALQTDALRQANSPLGGEGGLGSIGAGASAQPAAGVQTLANLGSPGQVETRFMGAAREAGLNNPIGLAALGATGLRESGWSPSKANATWSDPSQSGQPGTSGGILSWRGPRLQAMYKFAQSRGEQPGNISPETQAQFAFQEDPTLVHRLNATKTPEEANRVMAQAWRYAGYDGSGPEYQARLNATRQYMARYNGQGGQPQQGQPTQVAQATTAAPPPDQAGPANMPAQGAQQAQGYVIPGQQTQQGQPAPGEIAPETARAHIRELTRRMGHPGNNEGQRASYKAQIDQLTPYADPHRLLDRRSKELAIQKAERDLEAEGATPLTPEEKTAFGIAPGQAAHRTRRGDIKYGPAGTTINNNMPDRKGETKFAETLGAKQAERWNGYINEGDVAQGRLADIQTLRETSRRLGSQGAGANMKALIGPYAEALGIEVEGLPDIQLYTSIVNRLAPKMREPGSGATSNIEFEGFIRAIGPLSNAPEAREMILDTFEAATRNDLARAEIATRLATGEISRGQAEKELRSMPSPLEAYRAFRKANPALVGQAIRASAQQEFEERKAQREGKASGKSGPPPTTIQSQQQYQSLPRGATYTDPQGNVRTKQ